MTSDAGAFAAALQKESHTLKRALTDPHLFSGIGNAYSDEILHRARLSPFKLTRQLTIRRHRSASITQPSRLLPNGRTGCRPKQERSFPRR